jgi:hypothetical protein
MPLDEMSEEEMSIDKKSVDEMTYCQNIIFIKLLRIEQIVINDK